MSGGPPLLAIQKLSRRYPGVLAVDEVDLELQEGEIVGLVGPNGAGKSTLIKMLAGAVQPSGGTIEIQGSPVVFGGPAEATRHGLSFVHQQLVDAPNLTVAENVFLGLGYPRRFGVFSTRKELRRRTKAILEPLECDIDPDAMVGGLSIADRRVVTIARGLAANARLLVLDEPTASLTSDEIDHLFGVVRRSAARGTAIIYVSHRLEEIFALTSRVVVMRRGQVVADVPSTSLGKAELVRHMVGHEIGRPERQSAVVAASDGSEAPLLQVRGLGRTGVLEGIDFDLHRGEILGIAGLVGAGRSELLRLIAGADRATSGSVAIEGADRDVSTPARALRAGVVLLPESRHDEGLVMDFTIRQNITLPILSRLRFASRVPVPSGAREERASEDLIERLDVRAPSVETSVARLSGGNQQKVVLAKWLAHGAKVFLFDEPTHGVDVAGKLEIYRRCQEIANQGQGVIFVSSEFLEIEELCSRSLVLREGRLVADLRGDDITVANLTDHCYGAEAAA